MQERSSQKLRLNTCKLDKLVKRLLGETYEAHNAVEDVITLEIDHLKSRCTNGDIFYISYYKYKGFLDLIT